LSESKAVETPAVAPREATVPKKQSLIDDIAKMVDEER
jgi:hypothetical protein